MAAEGEGQATTKLTGIFSLELSSESSLEATAAFVLQVRLLGEANGDGTMMANLIRFTKLAGYTEGESFSELQIRLYKIMEYLDELKTGDILEIDTANFSVKLNGVNVYDKFKGDFIKISDKTQIIYEDSESTRDIELTVNYTEKYY